MQWYKVAFLDFWQFDYQWIYPGRDFILGMKSVKMSTFLQHKLNKKITYFERSRVCFLSYSERHNISQCFAWTPAQRLTCLWGLLTVIKKSTILEFGYTIKIFPDSSMTFKISGKICILIFCFGSIKIYLLLMSQWPLVCLGQYIPLGLINLNIHLHESQYPLYNIKAIPWDKH